MGGIRCCLETGINGVDERDSAKRVNNQKNHDKNGLISGLQLYNLMVQTFFG